MSYRSFAVAGDASDYLLLLLRLEHPAFGVSARAADTRDWTASVDGDDVLHAACGMDGDAPGLDAASDSGRGLRLTEPLDQDGFPTFEALAAVAGDDEPVTVTLAEHSAAALAADSTAAPLRSVSLQLGGVERDADGALTLSLRVPDYINRNAPVLKFTWANSPALRR